MEMAATERGGVKRSGLPQGITWHKGAKEYVVRIYLMGKMRHVGSFKELEQAIGARKWAEEEKRNGSRYVRL
jgi:hypothetical protein